MESIVQTKSGDIEQVFGQIRQSYTSFKAKGVRIDLTRGKPCAAQLNLSSELLSLPGQLDYVSEDGSDCRNYGKPQGLEEARRLFSSYMGAAPDLIVIANNSSLALMHDTVIYALLRGTCDASTAWKRQKRIAFLCPVPGYDRHFRICESNGIRMIPVTLREDGPDMEQVESIVAHDDSVKGMWCVPKYSNPTGIVYSDAVIERLAAMKAAASDFRLYWDNAYGVHHLTDEPIQIANVLTLCARHGHPNRPFVFGSTSKITFPGAGLAMFASSRENVDWILRHLAPRTIGPDKINQLRHVQFLKNEAGISQLMNRHKSLLAPKFNMILGLFDLYLSHVPHVRWTRPKGGYFITLQVPKGCAKRTIALAKEAGVQLTPAGSTHPHGVEAEDQTIRIAPTFPELQDLALAAKGTALSALIAVMEKIPATHWPDIFFAASRLAALPSEPEDIANA